MSDQDQITRHEREIGELRGKLDSLATKEYVREVVDEQTRDLKTEFNAKFDAVISMVDKLSDRLDKLSNDVQKLNEKQHRITGAADIIKTALPLLVSIATLIVLIISLLASAGA